MRRPSGYAKVTVSPLLLAHIPKKLRREAWKSASKRVAVKTASAHFRGLNLKVPLIFGLGADHLGRTSVPWTFHFLAHALTRKPGALLDIGANVGLYLIWGKAIDAGIEYIGFEPNPACYFYLHELIRYNRFTNARVIPVALASNRSMEKFFVRRHGDKMGSLLELNRAGEAKERTFELMTERGDEILRAMNLRAASVIKIDVEGAELGVLRGLRNTLINHRPTILCEIFMTIPSHPSYKLRVRKLEETLKFLQECDYRVLSLGEDHRLHVSESISDFRAGQQIDRVLVHADECAETIVKWAGSAPDAKAGMAKNSSMA